MDSKLKRPLLSTHVPAVVASTIATLYFLYLIGSSIWHGVFAIAMIPVSISFAESPLLFAALSLWQLALVAFVAGWGVEHAYYAIRLLRPSLGWPLRSDFSPYTPGVWLIRLAVAVAVVWLCFSGASMFLSE